MAKTCNADDTTLSQRDEPEERSTMDELTYDDVRARFKELGSTKEVCNEHPELKLGEVNNAVRSKNYEEYLMME